MVFSLPWLTLGIQQVRQSMAKIKYVLNERRLGMIAAAESTRPADRKITVHGQSPLGQPDPQSLSGWEEGTDVEFREISDEEAAALYPPKVQADAVVPGEMAGQIGEEADVQGLSGGTGDGERQKMDLNEESKNEAAVQGQSVAQEEIESKDEGFGGGREAKEFVQQSTKSRQ